jgi:hypothetical protein
MSQTRRVLIITLSLVLVITLALALFRIGQPEFAFALLLCAVLYVLFITGQKRLVYQIILQYVTEAENYWGSETGQIKFREVYARLMQELPWFIRILISDTDLSNWIEKALIDLKEELRKLDADTIEEGQLVIYIEE